MSGLEYPFRRHEDPAHCGYPGFELECDKPNSPIINILNITYHILELNQMSQILRVVREDMIDTICPENLVNTTIDHELFDFSSSYTNISLLFGCPIFFDVVGIMGSISCGNNGVSPAFIMPGVLGPGICETSVVIPFPVGFANSSGWLKAFQDGFEVRWKVKSRPCTDCTQSGGQCVYDTGTSLTACACPELPLLADKCSAVNKTDAKSSPSLSPSPSERFVLSTTRTSFPSVSLSSIVTTHIFVIGDTVSVR
nr:leaf rust 10 disease-resistance locus receptor-like protein kinase-like 1.3 [Tanacetum cinerariifolium]